MNRKKEEELLDMDKFDIIKYIKELEDENDKNEILLELINNDEKFHEVLSTITDTICNVLNIIAEPIRVFSGIMSDAFIAYFKTLGWTPEEDFEIEENHEILEN